MSDKTVNPDDAMKKLWQKGQQAWKDVESAAAWVEELRGNFAQTDHALEVAYAKGREDGRAENAAKISTLLPLARFGLHCIEGSMAYVEVDILGDAESSEFDLLDLHINENDLEEIYGQTEALKAARKLLKEMGDHG